MNDKSNIEILQIYDLPALNDLNDLSKQVRLSKDTIYRLSKYSSHFYKTYEIKKKNGGARLISQPSKMLKGLQSWILVHILNKLSPSPNCTGFRKGMNLLDNAMPHIGAVEILNMDISDFFTSTKSNKIFRLFKTIGYNKIISNILTRICCYKGYLPQGGPCSPVLANLTNIKLDRRISKYCSKNSIIYTRYADDLTFSIPILNFSKHVKNVITDIIENEGYKVNERKTRVQGLSSKQEVTGLVLTDDNVGIGRRKYRILRAKIHKMSQETEIDMKNIRHLNGWLAFLKDIDSKRHEQLIVYIGKLKVKYKSKQLEMLK